MVLAMLRISSLLFCLFVTEVQAFHWSGDSDVNVDHYACEGDSVWFPWSYTLDANDTIIDIRWYYQAENQSQQMVASYIDGHFFTTPEFAHFVMRAFEAGLSILHATVANSGKYMVELKGVSATNSIISTYRTTFLHVAGNLSVESGRLLVAQNPDAVMDKNNGSWHIQLMCGIFVGARPSDVIWTTPSGKNYSSSSYGNGYFYFTLQNPVEEGAYTCSLPSTCLKSNPELRKNASLTLEGVRVQLMLTEVRIAEVYHRLNQIEEKTSRQISFHVRLGSSVTISSQSPIIPKNVTSNQGGAYSPDTGKFTVPVNGTYVFLATAQVVLSNSYRSGGMGLMVDNTQVAYSMTNILSATSPYSVTVNSQTDMITCQAVVHLIVGQTVWLRADQTFTPTQDYTAFSGFLLHAD